MEINFKGIEEEIKSFWKEKDVYRVVRDNSMPKYYVLDMFPYPSGAGLHVGHPLGYIASDIFARYKRLKGFNVLHPMGYDSFGLPAEQYAIQTGQHPKITTDENIKTFRAQLDKLGFSFDWSRELRTSDPEFYRWTQWIFIKLFHSWYNRKTDRAELIPSLIIEFDQNGNAGVDAASDNTTLFSAKEWNEFSKKQQSDVLLNYRLAYIADSWVNWCPALGTVLANDEVKDGVSERGGYPVERKLMKQWSLRITAYAERLLQGLEKIQWSESLKESQRNWIGKSEGCSLKFRVENSDSEIEVFTTRPDTIFGATFITLAPEHELVPRLATDNNRKAVEDYIRYAKNRSERDRMADVKKITGQFTGAYAVHPFTQQPVPIWIGEYVLATYGTGAVMGVPGHDERDHRFASHFGLPIDSILKDVDVSNQSFDDKQGILANSGFLNGLTVKEAISTAIEEIEKKKIGLRKVNYKMRDAIFGRQRYWGEPIPVYYDEEGIARTVDEADLPVVLPDVDKYLPTESGEPPLARAKDWKYKGQYDYEHTTMPGWAGSSWYYLRYMDPDNKNELASPADISYWQNVDLYVGGDEHATGHLLYVRFWTKFLYDLGLIPFDEPAMKLVNQGKIQGKSKYGFRARPEMFAENLLHERLLQKFPGRVQRQKDNTGLQFDFEIQLDEGRVDIEVKNPREIREAFKQFHIARRMADKYKLVFVDSDDIIADVDSVLEKLEKSFNNFLVSKDLISNREGEPATWLVPFDSRLMAISGSAQVIVPSNYGEDGTFDMEKLRKWQKDFENAKLYEPRSTEKITYYKEEVEKMSKSKYNVVRPDKDEEGIPGIVELYGADCFRLYEMFLGPIEQHKPWDTKGIDGCYRFLKKLWKLFYSDEGIWLVTDEESTGEEQKVLHRTMKKVEEDIESMSFNTCVSAMMICVNELSQISPASKENGSEAGCHKQSVLEPLVILLSPFAPFMAEYLWKKLGHEDSIVRASFPEYDPALLVENSFEYPVAVNGKTRVKMNFALDLPTEQIEKEVISSEQLQKYFEGKSPRKVIVVKGRMINVVV